MFIKSLKSHPFSSLWANLSLADLEGGFNFISLYDGIIGFFFVNLKYFVANIVLGKYLELFFISAYSLKKDLTILSSIEWNVTTAITPPIGKILYAFINPFINSLISLFTKILRAWKTFVELFFKPFFFFILSII